MAHDDFPDSTLEVTVTADRDSLLKKTRATGEAILIVLNGSRVGYRAVLKHPMFVIGRGSAAGLQLEGDAISRIHARVVRDHDDYFLVDAGSTNGCFVNYTKIKKKKLADGDEIQIGHVLLKFLSGDNIETAYHEEYRRLVRHDALTGALNRPTFDEELRVLLHKSAAAPSTLSLIVFDLDHFKALNDTWGHTAGDLVLREVGAVVDKLVQAPHLFARIGGEEFAVIFSGDSAAAADFAEVLRHSIAALEINYERQQLTVTTSVGIAQADKESTPESLYQWADKNLYAAKQAGRNRVVAGTPSRSM